MTDQPKKKSPYIALAATILAAATPGVYSAYQSAKQEWKQKLQIEQQTRDSQESDIQANIRTHSAAIELLKTSCVTYRDLFRIMRRYSSGYATRSTGSAVYGSGGGSSSTAADPTSQEDHEDEALRKLETKSERATKNLKKLRELQQSTPSLKNSEDIRQQIQQQYSK